MTPDEMANLLRAIRADQVEALKARREGNETMGAILQAATAMVEACANIDSTCRSILAACEGGESDGSFVATMREFTAQLHAVAEGMQALPGAVSGRVSGDVAEAVRMFGAEVEPAPAQA